MKLPKCQKVGILNQNSKKMSKIAGNSNSKNVTNCGKFKFSKCQILRGNSNSQNVEKCGEIRIEIPQISKTAGNSNSKTSKSVGKFKFPKSCSEDHHFIHSLCFRFCAKICTILISFGVKIQNMNFFVCL